MSSIFISENDQRELLAAQAAIAMVLGNFQDGKEHTPDEYTNKVNIAVQSDKFVGVRENYKLDKFALAKSFELFGGEGKGGPISSTGLGETVEHTNKSKNAAIGSPGYGCYNSDNTSSFSLKLNSKTKKTRSRSMSTTSTSSSDTSEDDEDLAFIEKSVSLVKKAILKRAAGDAAADSSRLDLVSLVNDIVFQGLDASSKLGKRKEKEDLSRAKVPYASKKSKKAKRKILKGVKNYITQIGLPRMESDEEKDINISAIAADFAIFASAGKKKKLL